MLPITKPCVGEEEAFLSNLSRFKDIAQVRGAGASSDERPTMRAPP